MISLPEKGSAHGPVASPTEARVGLTPGSISPNNPAGIRADMAQTRAEMSATINSLHARLNPERLKEEATTQVRATADRVKGQATATVRAATIGKVERKAREMVTTVEETVSATRYGLADAIRHHPLPATLIGVGLTWLFLSGPEGSRRGNLPAGRETPTTRSPGPWPSGRMPAPPVRASSLGGRSVQNTVQTVAGPAGAKMLPAGQQVQQGGSQAEDQIENLTRHGTEPVQQLGDPVQAEVGDLSSTVQDQVPRLTTDV